MKLEWKKYMVLTIDVVSLYAEKKIGIQYGHFPSRNAIGEDFFLWFKLYKYQIIYSYEWHKAGRKISRFHNYINIFNNSRKSKLSAAQQWEDEHA